MASVTPRACSSELPFVALVAMIVLLYGVILPGEILGGLYR